MQAFAIVEADVVTDIRHGLFKVLELLEVHHLSLLGPEEGFHAGVVPTVALAAHADAQPGGLQGRTVLLAGILRTLI